MYVSSYFLIVQLNERKENPRGNPLGRGESREDRDRSSFAPSRAGTYKFEKRLQAFFFLLNPNKQFGILQILRKINFNIIMLA